ncbi:unnamed protein product [Arctogadus glacialis]
MTNWKMNVFGWCWILALVLCVPSEVFVKASLEVNETQQQQTTQGKPKMGSGNNMITTAQFECYQTIMKDNNTKVKGSKSMCNHTWDGWLCWEETKAGIISEQNCPNSHKDFDTSEMAVKICSDNGSWFINPKSGRTWSNYTRCNAHAEHGKNTAMNFMYLAYFGHGVSIISLIISLGIFFYFKSLSCQRITLHKNMFFSFVLNSVITIIWLKKIAFNQELVLRNPTSCKVAHLIHLYLFGCNYFWMLCEGIYLHTLIVVAVFARKQHLMWYYLLGWGFPLIPACIYAIARNYYYNDNCWISADTSLLHIIHGPICAALLVNLFFLLNIVRVLITKLKVSHQAESSLYMKAVRATLILIPLLGLQFLLLSYKPAGRVASEIYDYITQIFMHYQGLLVSTIFCFFNQQVQGVIRRRWQLYRIQCDGGLGSQSFGLQSATCTTTTEVQCHKSISGNSEHIVAKDSTTLRLQS